MKIKTHTAGMLDLLHCHLINYHSEQSTYYITDTDLLYFFSKNIFFKSTGKCTNNCKVEDPWENSWAAKSVSQLFENKTAHCKNIRS